MKKFLFLFLVLVFLPFQAYGQENWQKMGNSLNNAFFFVVDKIIALQSYFIGQALSIGKIVLLIAIFSAALNYALTGTGLKENIIKILKATVFFLIVIAAYPRIIGGITSWTFDMARNSIYPSVASYFDGIVDSQDYDIVDYSPSGRSHIQTTVTAILKEDNSKIFGDLLADRRTPRMDYTTVAPAAVFKIIFFLASDCFAYSDGSSKKLLNIIPVPDVRRWVVGLVCAFIIIFTGVFALLEYLVCFLEFMLVATVGVILFPLSIWEGSKFMAEKFIGAIVGFFIKLLFCNIAIFLLIYGFISMFYFFSGDGFQGTVDQVIFIFFICLMFLYICKSAPGLAQSLLSGTPSLSASGAISAVGGAVAAAGAVASHAGNTAGKVGKAGGAIVGGIAKTGFSAASVLRSADAAADTVKAAGGSGFAQMGAFVSSLGADAANSVKSGLTRSLLGSPRGKNNTDPNSIRGNFFAPGADGKAKSFDQHFSERKNIGEERGRKFMYPSYGYSPPASAPPGQESAGAPSAPPPPPGPS